MTDQQVAAHPDAAVSAEFTELASDERIAKAAAALERTASGRSSPPRAPTRGAWSAPFADGVEIYNNTSQTLRPSASPTTLNGPAATSHCGCGCTHGPGNAAARDAHPGRVARLRCRQRARAYRGPVGVQHPNGVANRLAIETIGGLADARLDVGRRRRLTGSVCVAYR